MFFLLIICIYEKNVVPLHPNPYNYAGDCIALYMGAVPMGRV